MFLIINPLEELRGHKVESLINLIFPFCLVQCGWDLKKEICRLDAHTFEVWMHTFCRSDAHIL